MCSVLKTKFQKEEPKILIYRYFTNFTYTDFQSELTSEPYNPSNSYGYCTFEKSCQVSDKHTPKKRKILRCNHKTHVNKILHLQL